MISLSDVKKWSTLENSEWQLVPSMDSNWFGKYTYSNDGYCLILSNGIFMYGDIRDENYVKDRASSWAPCLEGSPKDLSEEFLSHLFLQSCKVVLSKKTDNNMELKINGDLNKLPFTWVFVLTILPEDCIKHLWTFPLAVSLSTMSTKINQLEKELEKKCKELDELKGTTNKKRSINIDNNIIIKNSVENISKIGLGKPFCDHLIRANQINCHISPETSNNTKEIHENEKEVCKAVSKNSIKNKEFLQKNEERKAQKLIFSQTTKNGNKKKKLKI